MVRITQFAYLFNIIVYNMHVLAVVFVLLLIICALKKYSIENIWTYKTSRSNTIAVTCKSKS